MTAGLETFAKVRTLHDRTTTAGEKAAAASRMEALARSAGMTVDEAVSKLDANDRHGATARDFFDTPFFRQAKADGDRRRAEKWRKVLADYGSEEAVFAPGLWERALAEACDRFVVRAETTGWRMGSLSGWDLFTHEEPPSHIAEAVSRAYPLPETVRAAWDEFRFWEKLADDREARGIGYGDPAPEVAIRTRIVERMLNTMPAHCIEDMRARLDWFDHLNSMENAPDPKGERIRLATLRADIDRMDERMYGRPAASVHSGQKAHADRDAPVGPPDLGNQGAHVHSGHPRRPTRAERHAAIRTLLGEGHTDREIGRRLGISPTTVGTIRKSAQGVEA